MLEQEGFLLLRGGSLGKVTFVKIDGKYTARPRRVVAKGNRLNNPKYQSVHESESEFGTASKAGKVLRQEIGELLKLAKDNKVTSRLQKQMRKVLGLDTLNPRGKRNITDGDVRFLLGFNFNNKTRLRAAFNVRFKTKLNRDTGELTIDIPTIKPASVIKAPQGTTHFQIVSAGVAINFRDLYQTPQTKIIKSQIFTLDNNDTLPISCIHPVQPNNQNTLFLVLGLMFFRVIGDQPYGEHT